MGNVLLHVKERRIHKTMYMHMQFRITLTELVKYQASTDTSRVHLHGFEGKENVFITCRSC